MKKVCIIFGLIFHFLSINAGETVHTLLSPTEMLLAKIRVVEDAVDIDLFVHGEKKATARTVRFSLQNDLVADTKWCAVDSSYKEKSETWRPIFGERAWVLNRYNVLTLDLETIKEHKRASVEIRLYDEGVAFRTLFNEVDFWNETVTDEKTQFLFGHNCKIWAADFAQSAYYETDLGNLKKEIDRPQVIQVDKHCFVAVGEAALVDFARMKLKKSSEEWGLQSCLSGNVNLDLADYKTPWRYIMVAKELGELVQNNDFILNLNEPNKIQDTSWIKPGQVLREVTLTTEGALAAIDFASEHNISYIEFDSGWYGAEGDALSNATRVNIDPKYSKVTLDLHRVVSYAESKGIGVILYVNKKALYQQLDEILPLYKKWGIKGIKFGFVDVGDQLSTAWLHHAIRKAARYGLMVDVHDEYRPTGYSRTYPNLITQEGIRGDEESPTLKQSIYTLYNRMICGAGDYTNCYFAKRVTQKMGGRAAQLAKRILFYSPWQFIFWYDRVAGAPEDVGMAGSEKAVIRSDKFTDFYCSIPVTWDDTRFLDGEMGEYAVVARRSGSDWYIGILNAGDRRTITLPSMMLKSNVTYHGFMYYQPKEGQPEQIRVKNVDALKKGGNLTIEIAGNSGCVIHLFPHKNM